MLDSTGVGILTLLLAAGVFIFVNPIIALVPLALGGIPLAGLAVARGYKHIAPPVQTEHAPAVPSTREASYDPRVP
jgi:hypothetical protein